MEDKKLYTKLTEDPTKQNKGLGKETKQRIVSMQSNLNRIRGNFEGLIFHGRCGLIFADHRVEYIAIVSLSHCFFLKIKILNLQ